MDRYFGGVVWTDHALERLKERGIKQGDAWATWERPEQSRLGVSRGQFIYYRTYGDQRIEVVAGKDAKDKTVILSVWSRQVHKQKSYWKLGETFDNLLERFLRFLLGWAKRGR